MAYLLLAVIWAFVMATQRPKTLCEGLRNVVLVAVVFAIACSVAQAAPRKTARRKPAVVAAKKSPPAPSPVEHLLGDPAEDDQLALLACAVYTEAGGNRVTDDCRYAVIAVILNRVEDPRFPHTIHGVLTQKGQYAEFMGGRGVKWPKRAHCATEAPAVGRAWRVAIKALNKHVESPLRRAGYVWQAQFPQGKGRCKIDNMWFGK